MSDSPQIDATRLLRLVSQGDEKAASELLPLLYSELRRMAEGQMRSQRSDHTLQPTALVHEAWMRLVDQDANSFPSRSHFFALAAKAMRSILVDHARRRGAQKRGGKADRLPLDDDVALTEEDNQAIVDLDVALSKLADFDSELARVVELRFFGGMTSEETGEVLGVSSRTVERSWRTARAWLLANMTGDDEP